jgi:hypothetical protein
VVLFVRRENRCAHAVNAISYKRPPPDFYRAFGAQKPIWDDREELAVRVLGQQGVYESAVEEDAACVHAKLELVATVQTFALTLCGTASRPNTWEAPAASDVEACPT